MPTPHPDDRDTLKALDSLRTAATPPRPVRTFFAPTPVTPAAAPNPAPAPAGSPAADAAVRCLKCGYRLLLEGTLRCSECGREHSISELNDWYSGPEQRRLEHVIWLIAAGLFLRLWPVPQMLGLVWFPVLVLAPVAAVALAGWACIIAGSGRMHEPAGRYAVAGAITAAIAVAWALAARDDLLASPASILTLAVFDIMLAWLLLGAMSRPVGSSDVWGMRRGRWIAFIGLFVTPAIGVAYVMLNSVLFQVSEQLADAALNSLLAELARSAFSQLLPWFVVLAIWFIVWRWFTAMRRTLFAPRER